MKGLALGVIVAIIVACGGKQAEDPAWIIRQRKLDAMDHRLAEIRQWRHERGIRAELPQSDVSIWLPRTLPQAKNVCPENHAVPKTCGEICTLSDDICDNAEAICAIADELGKDDHEGQERCASAKASCHDAKQRCCDCAAAAAKDATP